MEDEEHSSRPEVIDADQIKTLIKNNPGHTTRRNVAEILSIPLMSIVRHLKTLGYDVWVSHNLMEKKEN